MVTSRSKLSSMRLTLLVSKNSKRKRKLRLVKRSSKSVNPRLSMICLRISPRTRTKSWATLRRKKVRSRLLRHSTFQKTMSFKTVTHQMMKKKMESTTTIISGKLIKDTLLMIYSKNLLNYFQCVGLKGQFELTVY